MLHEDAIPYSKYNPVLDGIWRQGGQQRALFNTQRGTVASAVDITPHGDLWMGEQRHLGVTGGWQNPLEGYVAEMLIYDRALSLLEVEANLTYLQGGSGISKRSHCWILIYEKALAPEELTHNTTYLANKWGITI